MKRADLLEYFAAVLTVVVTVLFVARLARMFHEATGGVDIARRILVRFGRG